MGNVNLHGYPPEGKGPQVFGPIQTLLPYSIVGHMNNLTKDLNLTWRLLFLGPASLSFSKLTTLTRSQFPREREMQALFLLTVQRQEDRENSVVWDAAVFVFVFCFCKLQDNSKVRDIFHQIEFSRVLCFWATFFFVLSKYKGTGEGENTSTDGAAQQNFQYNQYNFNSPSP